MPKHQYKAVAFGEITILEFPQVLGDNPACSGGAPVQLDWEPALRETHDLDFFEFYNNKEKGQSSSHKKKSTSSSKKKNLVATIPVPERAELLMRNGYSLEEIAHAVMLVQQVQEQRKESMRASGFGDNIKSVLGATATLPVGMVRSVLKSVGLTNKQQKYSANARSA